MTWPTSTLDRVQQLRVLSRVLTGVAIEERTIAAPFDVVWNLVTDLPNSVPKFDRDVASVEILEHNGERVKIRARQRYTPIRITSDVEIREGWCWMVARPQLYVVGMAAEPEGERTRFALLEGMSLQSHGALRRLVAPVHAVSRWRHRRHVPHDVNGIERLLGLR